jgi:Lamin Tail Domain
MVNITFSSTIVISEFRTRGPNGGNDEFIELYNLSSSPINISGWEIKGSNNTGTVSTRAVINNGVVLNSGCHYLLTNSNPTGGPYSDAVAGNQTYGVGITDDGGIALTLPSGAIVDQVGMSSGSTFKEGSTLSPLATSSNRGYERRPGGSAGSSIDSDNNNADFRLISPSDPQSASSACIGGDSSTNPSGFGGANPSSGLAGSNTLLTVNVSPGTNPSSTGITVTGNLSEIGGSASQQLCGISQIVNPVLFALRLEWLLSSEPCLLQTTEIH